MRLRLLLLLPLLLLLLNSGCQTKPQFGIPVAEMQLIEERHAESELIASTSLAQLALDNAAIKLYLWDKFEMDNPKYQEQHDYLVQEYEKRKAFVLQLYEKVGNK